MTEVSIAVEASEDFTVVDTPATVLGEGPMWSVRDQSLYWIDIVSKCVYRLEHATGRIVRREMPYAPSAVIPRAEGGLLVVTKKGMALLDDFEHGAPVSIKVPLVDFTREVFNDAKCDAAGRLWVGTRDLNNREPNGRLYCMQPDLSLRCQVEGIVVSNGLGWSPDGLGFYYADSRPGRVDVFDFDAGSGELSRRHVFVDYTHRSGEGHPDGLAVDVEGGVWVAEVGDWHIRRYRPDGSLDREIRTPMRKPTSLMFGGPDLRTLYMTSMQFGLTEQELREQPLAGRLLSLDVGVAGQPEHMFGFSPGRVALP